MSTQYQRFLKVLEKWPLDKSKAGRDLSDHIRKHLKSLTNPASLTNDDTVAIATQIDSLERLANNVYGKKYPRIYNSTASGLSVQQCNQVLSSEFLQYLKERGSKKT